MGVHAFEHNQIDANGISINTVSAGEGPLVVFCHGFPECWYSWRHQLPVVAAAGFRAVVGMSVPYVAPAVLPAETLTRRMRSAAGPDREYYRLYFR
jgi:pimeloyl-ACP methyl ester carboxylesterase